MTKPKQSDDIERKYQVSVINEKILTTRVMGNLVVSDIITSDQAIEFASMLENMARDLRIAAKTALEFKK